MVSVAKRFTTALYEQSPVFVQNTLVSLEGWRLWRQRFGTRFDEMMAFFEQSQWWPPKQLEEWQNERLRTLISHAYESVPYYQQLMRQRRLTPDDIRRVADLYKLPVLTKETVRTRFKSLISVRHGKLVEGHSSGTTGSPISVLWDENAIVAHNAALWRHRRWAGFRLGRPYASLLGRVVVPIKQRTPPFWRHNRPWNQLFLSSFHLEEEFLPSYFDAMRDYGVEALQAYPSTVFILARYLEQLGRTFPLQHIFTSSEPLLDMQRQVIQDRFGCQVYDCYGLAERCMYAGECPMHQGHHLYMEYGITEIVDDRDQPVGDGCYGRIVATGLHNFGMPLIRYEVGDISAYKTVCCACGRGLPLLEAVTTKAEDIVVTPEGKFISASVLTHPFKPMHHVEKSQLIQEALDELRIMIVRRPGYTAEDTSVLLGEMRKRVGTRMNIRIEFVEDIPRSRNGKYRWVISKVPLGYKHQTFKNLYDIGDV